MSYGGGYAPDRRAVAVASIGSNSVTFKGDSPMSAIQVSEEINHHRCRVHRFVDKGQVWGLKRAGVGAAVNELHCLPLAAITTAKELNK